MPTTLTNLVFAFALSAFALCVHAHDRSELVDQIGDVNPAQNVDDLTLKMLTRLDGPIMIYQLDITAFPGNSGSPVLSRKTGEVFGVLNKVFVSGGKEAALENPSGISYAVPVKYIRNLAQRNNVSLD
jgi:serine protease Do